jgi:hypothetical protein
MPALNPYTLTMAGRRHIFQPTPYSCGQTCLAMILGHKDAWQVLADLPDHKNGTYASELRDYLRDRGWQTGDKLERVYKHTTLPPIAILRHKWPERTLGHWVLWIDGRTYDPTLGAARSGYKLTSFLRVGPDLRILR